jgi:hypothetical protein
MKQRIHRRVSTRGFAFATLLALASFASFASFASSASAQVVVVRLDPAAEPVSEALESGLGHWGVVPDPGYYGEALRQGLDPSSDMALERLIPPLQARIALVPRAGDEDSVLVEFRDGGTGGSLGDATIPLDAGALGATGQRVLDSELSGRLGVQPPAAPESGEGAGAEPAGDDELRPLLRLYGGVGFGTRNFDWPGVGRDLAVATGVFAAFDVGIRFLVGVGDTLAVGPAFAYQTSIAHEVEEKHIAGQPDTLRIRAHRFDGTFIVQIGRKDGFQVTPGAGVAVHNLRPEVHHLRTPAYSLAGPVLRIGVRIPIGPIALRIAPEAAWLFTDEPLEEIGVQGSGPGIGGEVALEIPIAEAFALEVTARDVRAWLPAREGSKATDTGLFATTRLVWQP